MVKSHGCSKCDQIYASPQSLWNHKQRCQGNPHVGENMMQVKVFQDAEQKRSTTSTFDGYNKPSQNPKIQALVNEIINDSTSTAKSLPTTANGENASWKQSTTVLPPAREVVVDVFRKKSLRDRVLPPEVIIDAPRTKGDIVGCSDDEQVDELPFRTKEA